MKKKDIAASQKNEFLSINLKSDLMLNDKQAVIKTVKDKFFDLVKNDEKLRKKLKVNNNLSNLNIPGNNSINTSNSLNSSNPQVQTQNTFIPQVQPQTNYNPYQNNSMYQQQQPGYYNQNQGGSFGSYTYK
jgi:hypothetical protein